MAEFDSVIRGGVVVDGTNTPRRRADVAIKDGHVAAIRKQIRNSEASTVFDASGLIVAPGFIDLHTHYDAQLFWDPYCSISGWHGVTTVLIGNCGFGFAPAAEVNREYLTRSLTRVEAIPYDAVKAALTWNWRSFPEFMDEIDSLDKAVNVLTFQPLNPLMVDVMGVEGAKSRDATPGERAEMIRLVREALDAGACGWSAQHEPPVTGQDVQRDWDGTPFATDLMSDDFVLAMAAVLAEYDGAFCEYVRVLPKNKEERPRHRVLIEDIAARSGSPVLWNALTYNADDPSETEDTVRWIRACQERGNQVYAQMITRDAAHIFTLEYWNLFDDSPAWRQATLGTPAERLASFRDPAVRQALREQPPGVHDLDAVTLLNTTSPKFLPAKGTRLPDAARILGYDNLTDLIVDVVVDDQLKTVFQVAAGLGQRAGTLDNLAKLAKSPYGIWGLSDAGAHTKFFTGGAQTTQHLIEVVRERETVSLEEAHWRLSGLPARVCGLGGNRGTLLEGAPADMIAYDFEALRLHDEEVVYDLPGDGDDCWRRIRRADGYRYTFVNGVLTLADGQPSNDMPGQLLRRRDGGSGTR